MRALIALLVQALPLSAQDTPDFHGTRPATLEIRNAHVVRGDGAPAFGPTSVFVRDGRIVAVGTTSLMLHYPPYYGQERTVEMLRLFAKEVLPHVQAMSAPRVAAE